jgi:hypothetical protein
MAARKMTFSIPEDLARRLVRRVPARERSRFVVQALENRMAGEDAELVAACLAANKNPVVRREESGWVAMTSSIEEPWDDAVTR